MGLCLVLIGLLLPCPVSSAASGPTLKVTLADNSVQYGSKKTFDVWARNSSGQKIKATVKLNGNKLEPTWDDSEKASYTLTFAEEGMNTVTVSASSDGGKRKELTYHITYKKAQDGEKIGTAVWSVELFTLESGYLIYPCEVPIYEGETAAEQLIRLLHSNGFVGYYGGTPKSSFYLAYIADGTAKGTRYNNYQKSGTPAAPRALNITPSVSTVLEPHLKNTMTFYDPGDYQKNWMGYLGEFAITNGSGWMYSVNNIFPNVGFADSYLSDGDVVRVQFTLGYGADIGGFGSVGTSIPDVDTQPTSGYFAVADKDMLTKSICSALVSGLTDRVNVSKAYDSAIAAAVKLDASQSTVDTAVRELNNALENPSEKAVSTLPTTSDKSGTTASDTVSDNTFGGDVSEPCGDNGSDNGSTSATGTVQSGLKPTDGDTAGTSATENGSENGTSRALPIVIFVAVGLAVVFSAILYIKKKGSR